MWILEVRWARNVCGLIKESAILQTEITAQLKALMCEQYDRV